MGAYIGNASKLQQALDSAVLAVFTVENREHHIDLLPYHSVTLEAQKALATNRRDGRRAVIGVGLPGTAGQHGIVIAPKEDPVALLSDTNRENIILIFIQGFQHILCRAQGNLMFRADTAKQDTNAKFFHIIASFYIIFYIFHLEIKRIGAIMGTATQGGTP
jgi:hypothetical protein